ncbi:putative reverse transcriptase domain-containing protein [Tanacetum coccineum]|uniref:Reverse transcriptase domain-containing protein n=1 Tax=Tanacetum coccineum TaxID=301880 RepID=A0ABQ4XHA0_9ASTR
MSDSEHSTVTYTSVSFPVEDGSDIGSPGVDGPPIMPEDPYAYIMAAYQVPPSPDYIPGLEVPPSPDYIPGPKEPQSPPPLDFVPEPMYPEYIPQEDEILPAEEQPLPAAASPTADSPGYVPESDPEEEPEEDDEDPEEDPADYPADRDDDDDDEDEDEDEEEEEEHPAPADSVPPVHRMTARISIRDEPSISLPPREEVERLLALTTPPPSPLTPLSSLLPHIPFPPLPASPPLQLLSSDHKTDRPEITLPTQKSLGIDLGLRYDIGESLAAAATRPIRGRRADYRFVDPREAVEEVAPIILKGVNARVTRLTAVQEQDTQDIYAVIEDTQDRQTQIYQSVRTLVDDKIMALHSVVMGQEAVISQLQATDRKSQTQMAEFQRQLRPAKVRHSLMHQERPVAVPTFGYVVAMLCSLLSIMGYSQLGDCIDLLFCLATQYRSFVQKMAPKRTPRDAKIKFATCTLQGISTWLNSHVKEPLTPEAAHAMPWRTLKKMMIDKYSPRGEIKKLEFEMWNLKVKGNDVVAYSQRFQELALMCDRMFPKEIDQVEKYVGGLPDTIHGSVMATKPKTMQDAIEFATELMDKKINTWAERQADNKRKSDDTASDNQSQQPNKRQNTGRAYAAGNGDRKPHRGPKPLCSKCNYHHEGPCAPKCSKCNRFGHLGHDYRSPPNVNTLANQMACFEYSAQGHFKKDCPKLKNNNNRGNQAGNAKAQAKVYAVGNAGVNPDNNVVTDHDYNVELADGRIVGLNTIIWGCTLNLLNHPFNIDLMPVELGSFDMIIGMDWLVKYHAVIVYAEKIICIPFGDNYKFNRVDEAAINTGPNNLISCAKAQ